MVASRGLIVVYFLSSFWLGLFELKVSFYSFLGYWPFDLATQPHFLLITEPVRPPSSLEDCIYITLKYVENYSLTYIDLTDLKIFMYN